MKFKMFIHVRARRSFILNTEIFFPTDLKGFFFKSISSRRMLIGTPGEDIIIPVPVGVCARLDDGTVLGKRQWVYQTVENLYVNKYFIEIVMFLPHSRFVDLFKLKPFATTNVCDSKIENCFGKDRKHFGKRRKC